MIDEKKLLEEFAKEPQEDIREESYKRLYENLKEEHLDMIRQIAENKTIVRTLDEIADELYFATAKGTKTRLDWIDWLTRESRTFTENKEE